MYIYIYIYIYYSKTKSFFFFFKSCSPFTPLFIYLFAFFSLDSPLFSFRVLFLSFILNLTPQRSQVSVVLRRSDLLIRNILEGFSTDSEIALMAFFFHLSYLVDSKFCIKICLRNPDSRPQSDNMLFAIDWICIVLPAPDTFRVFFRRPYRYFLPKGLSVPSAQPAM